MIIVSTTTIILGSISCHFHTDINSCDNAADNDCDSATTMCVDTTCGYECTCLDGCEMIPGDSNMCQGTYFN